MYLCIFSQCEYSLYLQYHTWHTGMPGTNAAAYFAGKRVMRLKKEFPNTDNRCQFHKHFTLVIYSWIRIS